MQVHLDRNVARDLLARWDAQQERYIARREQRFDLIVEAVRLQVGAAPTVIDLCCGPGSLDLTDTASIELLRALSDGGREV